MNEAMGLDFRIDDRFPLPFNPEAGMPSAAQKLKDGRASKNTVLNDAVDADSR